MVESRDDVRSLVVLRPLRRDDLDRVFEWERDPGAVALAAVTRADPTDRAAFDAHMERVMNRPDVLNLAIEVGGDLAGMIAAFTIEGDREVSYWVDPARWGRGIATRALALLLNREPTRPLHARVAVHNVGSQRVLERASFVAVREERAWADGVGREVAERIYRLD